MEGWLLCVLKVNEVSNRLGKQQKTKKLIGRITTKGSKFRKFDRSFGDRRK